VESAPELEREADAGSRGVSNLRGAAVDAIPNVVDALVHYVDAAFLGDGAGEDVVGEERGWVRGYVVVHHLEIDGVILFHGGGQTLDLFAFLGDVENPIAPFTGKAVGG